jgi:transglutaminase-like putative cysteine protease
MNRYRLAHVTEFLYDGNVSESYNEVRLRPMHDDTQSCLSFRLTTEPPTVASSHIDHMGNWVHRFNLLRHHRRLRIETDSVVLVQAPREGPGASVPLSQIAQLSDELDEHYDLLRPTDFVPHLPELEEMGVQAEKKSDGTVAGFSTAVTELVVSTFRYEKGATHVHSSIHDALQTHAGVCQDFAHIMLSVVRMRGVPARYVSGYLVPSSAAEPGASVEDVVGGQASHAWVEVYFPQHGWMGFDPTLGRPTGAQHVRVAYGRDYGDVAPVRGVYKGHAGQRLSVDVRVRPALDHEGNEQLQETAAAPPELEAEDKPQQQQQQQ